MEPDHILAFADDSTCQTTLPGMKWRLLIAALCARMELVEPHGAMTFPPPRNAVDSDEAPWSGGVPIPVPFQPWCPFPSSTEAGNAQNLSASNGQACFWFSNGCAIGCEKCDGSTRGPEAGHVCENPMKPTLCDPSKRTVNTGAECGSKEDTYYYTPWR